MGKSFKLPNNTLLCVCDSGGRGEGEWAVCVCAYMSVFVCVCVNTHNPAGLLQWLCDKT